MIIKNTFIYLLGRGFPGVISVLAVLLYTRLLSPSQYGEYALSVGAVSAASAVSLYWVRLSVLRFFCAWDRDIVLRTARNGFFISVGLVTLIAGSVIFPYFGKARGGFLLISWALFIVLGWLDLNLEIIRAEERPQRYVTLLFIKAFFGLLTGFLLVRAGFGAIGALSGLVCGILIASCGLDWGQWKKIGFNLRSKRERMLQFSRYGTPLAMVFAMGAVMGYLDRFMIAILLDTAEAGRYAATYDLTAQLLTFLMVSVYMAGQPLLFRSFEQDDFSEAKVHFDHYGVVLLAIGLPAAVGMSLLRQGTADLALGSEFSEAASKLIPYIAMATLFGGLKAFYADFSFQLKHKTLLQVIPVLCGVIINGVLNLLLIPMRGIEGAAMATLISFFAAFVLSVYLGQRHLRYIQLRAEHKKIIISVAVMSIVVLASHLIEGIGGWIVGFVSGSLTYAASLYFMLFKKEMMWVCGRKDVK